jgi:AcrR family transcriptional regulator
MERPRSRLPASDRRQQILTTAEALFAARGFETVTMGEIAIASGVARPTVYAYFPNTAAILDALLDAVVSRVWERLQPLLASREGPPDAETYAAIFTALTHENAGLAILRSGGSPLFQSRRKAVFDARLAEALSPHIGPGTPRYVVPMLVALFEGTAYWAVSEGLSDVDTLAHEVAAFIDRGLPRGDGAACAPPRPQHVPRNRRRRS